MNIALASIDTTVADFERNFRKIVALGQEAASQGADLLVTPELSVCGYFPYDLLRYDSFLRETESAVNELKRSLPPELPVVVGWVRRDPTNGALYNTASILYRGEEVARQAKTLIPNYDVFDERRYFSPLPEFRPWEYRGYRIGLLICEDLWFDDPTLSTYSYPVDPVAKSIAAGATFLVGISASPFEVGKLDSRISLVRRLSQKHRVPIAYANLVGGNDGLIFDGASFLVDSGGRLRHVCRPFEESLEVARMDGPSVHLPESPPEEQLYQALVLGTRDFVHKTGFRTAHLGLSGGVDSALVAVVARQALGAENVTCLALPSRHSSRASVEDAEALARNLGVRFEVVSIDEAYQRHLDTLGPVLGPTLAGVTSENLQARIRGTFLMAWSNAHGSLLLTTGNKSELAVGYCTLYGDMCGALSVIGDLFKTEVYRVCRWINDCSPVIPENILTKAPSAELRENQTDQDTLPPYEVLDRILALHLLENKTAAEIEGFPPELVQRVLHLTAGAEHKRHQAAPILKVSPRSFGLGRRMCLARQPWETRMDGPEKYAIMSQIQE